MTTQLTQSQLDLVAIFQLHNEILYNNAQKDHFDPNIVSKLHQFISILDATSESKHKVDVLAVLASNVSVFVPFLSHVLPSTSPITCTYPIRNKLYATSPSTYAPVKEDYAVLAWTLLKHIRLLTVDRDTTVRTQALRTIRYFFISDLFIEAFLAIGTDYLIARCVERENRYLPERVQALKCIRHILSINSQFITRPIIATLLALCEQPKEEFRIVALDTIKDLLLVQPAFILGTTNARQIIIDAILDPTVGEVSAPLTWVLLYLYDNPSTRQLFTPGYDFGRIFACYTDLSNTLVNTIEQQPGLPPLMANHPLVLKEKEVHRASAHRVLLTFMRSLGGLFALSSEPVLLQSFIHLLSLPSRIPQVSWAKESVFEFFYDALRIVTSYDLVTHKKTLISYAKQRSYLAQKQNQQQLYLLSQYVEQLSIHQRQITSLLTEHQHHQQNPTGTRTTSANELSILKQSSTAYHSIRHVNLLHTYMVLVLTICIRCGLLEHLSILALCPNDDLSIPALKLLTEILRLSYGLFPSTIAAQLQTFPALLQNALLMGSANAAPSVHSLHSQLRTHSNLPLAIDTSLPALSYNFHAPYTTPHYITSLITSPLQAITPVSSNTHQSISWALHHLEQSSQSSIRMRSLNVLSHLFHENVKFLSTATNQDSFLSDHERNTTVHSSGLLDHFGVHNIGDTTDGVCKTSFLDHGFDISRLLLDTDQTSSRHSFLSTNSTSLNPSTTAANSPPNSPMNASSNAHSNNPFAGLVQNKNTSSRPHKKSRELHSLYLQTQTNQTEAQVTALIKSTNVLGTKDQFQWDFPLILQVLETCVLSRTHFLTILKTKFFKRLLSFLRPDKHMFCDMYLTIPHAAVHAKVAAQLIRVIVMYPEGREYQFFIEVIDLVIDALSEEAQRAESVSVGASDKTHPAHRIMKQHVLGSSDDGQSANAGSNIGAISSLNKPSVSSIDPNILLELGLVDGELGSPMYLDNKGFFNHGHDSRHIDLFSKDDKEQSKLTTTVSAANTKPSATTPSASKGISSFFGFGAKDKDKKKDLTDKSSIAEDSRLSRVLKAKAAGMGSNRGLLENSVMGTQISSPFEEDSRFHTGTPVYTAQQSITAAVGPDGESLGPKFRPFSHYSVTHKLCREYVTFLGILSSTPYGLTILLRYGFFDLIASFGTCQEYDYLSRLFLFNLDFTNITSNTLHSTSLLEYWILHGSTFLRRSIVSLLRTISRQNVEKFRYIGIELCVALTHSPDPQVSLSALALLEESCYIDPLCLELVLKRAPDLTHFGQFVNNLYIHFLSKPEGVSVLMKNGWLIDQLKLWQCKGVTEYLESSEYALSLALSAHVDISSEDSQSDSSDVNRLSMMKGLTGAKNGLGASPPPPPVQSSTQLGVLNPTQGPAQPLTSPSQHPYLGGIPSLIPLLNPKSSIWSQYTLHQPQLWSTRINIHQEHDEYIRQRLFHLPWNIEIVVETAQRRIVQLIVDTFVFEGFADAGAPVINDIMNANPYYAQHYGLLQLVSPENVTKYQQYEHDLLLKQEAAQKNLSPSQLAATAVSKTASTQLMSFTNTPKPLLANNELEGSPALWVCGLCLDVEGQPSPIEIDQHSILHSRLSPFILSTDIMPIGSSNIRQNTLETGNAFSNFVNLDNTKLITTQYLDQSTIPFNAQQPISNVIRKCYPSDRRYQLLPSVYNVDSPGLIYNDINTNINISNWTNTTLFSEQQSQSAEFALQPTKQLPQSNKPPTQTPFLPRSFQIERLQQNVKDLDHVTPYFTTTSTAVQYHHMYTAPAPVTTNQPSPAPSNRPSTVTQLQHTPSSPVGGSVQLNKQFSSGHPQQPPRPQRGNLLQLRTNQQSTGSNNSSSSHGGFKPGSPNSPTNAARNNAVAESQPQKPSAMLTIPSSTNCPSNSAQFSLSNIKVYKVNNSHTPGMPARPGAPPPLFFNLGEDEDDNDSDDDSSSIPPPPPMDSPTGAQGGQKLPSSQPQSQQHDYDQYPTLSPKLPKFSQSSFYFLDGDVRWNFYRDPNKPDKLYLTSVWYKISPSHDVLPTVSVTPHLYGELSKTLTGCGLLFNSNILQDLTTTMCCENGTYSGREGLDAVKKQAEQVEKMKNIMVNGISSSQSQESQLSASNQVLSTLLASMAPTSSKPNSVSQQSNHINRRAAMWALAQIGSSEYGSRLLIRHGIITYLTQQAISSPILSFRGACFYLIGLLSLSRTGREHLSILGWDSTEEDAQIASIGIALPRDILSFLNVTSTPLSRSYPLQPLLSSPLSSLSVGDSPHAPISLIQPQRAFGQQPTISSTPQSASSLQLQRFGAQTPSSGSTTSSSSVTTVIETTADGSKRIDIPDEIFSRYTTGVQAVPISNLDPSSEHAKAVDEEANTILSHCEFELFGNPTQQCINLILGHISNLCNHVSQRSSLTILRLWKQKYKHVFNSPVLFAKVTQLLQTHTFSLPARRFIIFDLFGRCFSEHPKADIDPFMDILVNAQKPTIVVPNELVQSIQQDKIQHFNNPPANPAAALGSTAGH